MKSQHPEKSPQCFWRSLFKQNSSSPSFPLIQNWSSYKHPELCCHLSGQFLTSVGEVTFRSEDNPVFLPQSPAQYSQMEQDALKLAQEISAEYWAVSSLTGEFGTFIGSWRLTNMTLALRF